MTKNHSPLTYFKSVLKQKKESIRHYSIATSLSVIGVALPAAGLIANQPVQAAPSAEQTIEQPSESVTPNWYLHLDVEAFYQSELGKNLLANEHDSTHILPVMVGRNISDNTRYITAYGQQMGDEDVTLVFEGHFADVKSAIEKDWQERGLNYQEQSDLKALYKGILKPSQQELEKLSSQDDSINYNHDEDDNDPSNDPIYAKVISDSMVVMSRSKNQISDWASGKRQLNKANNNALFEVVVDINQAMMHGGMNLDEVQQQMQFESISAKQIQQVSVKYQEIAQTVELELGLLANDSTTASQVKSIALGLIALKSLSSDDADLTSLLNNIQINQHLETLNLKLSGTVRQFQKFLD